jgi:hypothetical protein
MVIVTVVVVEVVSLFLNFSVFYVPSLPFGLSLLFVLFF